MTQDQLLATIDQARRGQSKALEALLEAYGPRLHGYFLRATGNHHDAEDLLSELTLRLVRQITKYDDRGRFDQWLFRIAANLVRDRIRRKKAAPSVISFSAGGEEGSSLADGISGDDGPVEADVLAKEASLELNDALARLEPMTRELILLRHFGELSFRELAELYKCPVGTVLARVHRGLKALRKLMGDHEP